MRMGTGVKQVRDEGMNEAHDDGEKFFGYFVHCRVWAGSAKREGRTDGS
jgi:hypothetical protein